MKPIPFKLSDGGCSLSCRPHEYRDCVVAAFAVVTGKPYDEIYDIIALAGRPPNQGFESDVWLKRMRGKVLGGQFKAVKVRIKSPVGRMISLTPRTFGLLHPKGRYILETASHTWAIVDSVHHDLALPKDKPLTGAWRWVTP